MAGNHACFERGPRSWARSMQLLNREPTEEEILRAINTPPYPFKVGDRVYNIAARRYGIIIMVNDHRDPQLDFDYVVDYPKDDEYNQTREMVKNTNALIKVT